MKGKRRLSLFVVSYIRSRDHVTVVEGRESEHARNAPVEKK